MEIALWTLLNDKLFLAHSDRVAGNILENQAVGSNDDIITNGHTFENHSIGPNPAVCSNLNRRNSKINLLNVIIRILMIMVKNADPIAKHSVFPDFDRVLTADSTMVVKENPGS